MNFAIRGVNYYVGLNVCDDGIPTLKFRTMTFHILNPLGLLIQFSKT